MSVVGFDIGYQTCYVAVARQGGIEAIANEYSDRCTPSCVSMGERNRCMGASAKNQMITNVKNTIWGWKKLLGRNFSEPSVMKELSNFTYEVLESKDNRIGIRVMYLGEKQVFTPEQVNAMMLTKLKEIAEAYLKTKVVDCVISVPCYFSDRQRRAVLDSASMVGLNVLRLMNDTAATALSYGIYKQDLPAPEEKPRHVVFVDMGHSDLQLGVCAFNKGKLKMLATEHDPNLGGVSFDRLLAEYFADDFKQRYKVDARTNPRAYLRLLSECERLKKLMSANSQEIPLNIECFMNDKDVSGKMSRAAFETLAGHLLESVDDHMRRVLQLSKLSKGDIYSVELVGGSSRIPAVKELVRKVFDREASTTLNADEAVARGCALQCAILSPTFRVRDFAISDAQPYAINLSWQGAMDDEGGCSDMEIFQQFHSIPFAKMLTFYRKDPFTLAAKYSTLDDHITESFIGSFQIDGITPDATGNSRKVKVKVRVNGSGLFSISEATFTETIENVTGDEPESMEVDGVEGKPSETAMDAEGGESKDSAAAQPAAESGGETPQESVSTEDASGKEATAATGEQAAATDVESEKPKSAEKKKKKNLVKTVPLPIVPFVINLPKDEVNLCMEQEGKMVMQDKMEKERVDAMNAVEEYVYEMRDKLSGPLSEFMKEQDREAFLAQLEKMETWLYEDGEFEAKQAYTDRLTQLKNVGQPVVSRFREFTDRPPAFEQLGLTTQLAMKFVEAWKAKDEKYDHIEAADVDKVMNAAMEKRDWMERQAGQCAQLPTYADPPVTVSQINAQRESLISTCNPIMNKPKPKPKEDPPKDDAKSPANDNGATTNGPKTDQTDEVIDNAGDKSGSKASAADAKVNPEMELD